MKCSICEKCIPEKNGWSQGNNAQPVNNGRCCDECNARVVIPARLREMRGRQGEEEDQEHWLYLLHYNGYTRVVGEDDNWSVAHEMTGDTGRLFAAAPALLSALKDCVEWLESVPLGDSPQRSVTNARAIIAKVEGRIDT